MIALKTPNPTIICPMGPVKMRSVAAANSGKASLSHPIPTNTLAVHNLTPKTIAAACHFPVDRNSDRAFIQVITPNDTRKPRPAPVGHPYEANIGRCATAPAATVSASAHTTYLSLVFIYFSHHGSAILFAGSLHRGQVFTFDISRLRLPTILIAVEVAA